MIKRLFHFIQNNSKNIVAIILIILVTVTIAVFAFRTKQTKDPNTNKVLQVGLVNEDDGGQFNGKQYNFGKDFVNLLTRNHDISWYSVPRDVAENGLKQRRYDLIVILPFNFSNKILQFQAADFKKIRVLYKIRKNKNPVLQNKITQLNNQILNKLNYKVTEMYLASILFNLHQAQKHLEVVNFNEQQLSSNLKGDLNNPLAAFIKEYSQAMPNATDNPVINANNHAGDDHLQNLLQNQGINNFQQIDAQAQLLQNQAHQQLNELSTQANSVIQANNQHFLDLVSHQYDAFQTIINDDNFNLNQLQAQSMQKQISDLLNSPAWLPETNAAFVQELQNQKLQLGLTRNKLNRCLATLQASSVVNTNNTHNGIGDERVSSVKQQLQTMINSAITQLPTNSSQILQQISSDGELTLEQVQNLQVEWAAVNNFQTTGSFQGQEIALQQAALAPANQPLVLNLPAHQHIFLNISSNQVDLHNLAHQLEENNLSVMIQDQGLAINNVGEQQNLTLYPQVLAAQPVDYSVTISAPSLKQGVLTSLINNQNGSFNTQYLDFIVTLNQAYTFITTFSNLQFGPQSTALAPVKTVSAFDANLEQKLLAILINVNSAEDSITKLQTQYEEQLRQNQQAKADFQQLVVSIQKLYQEQLASYRQHQTMISPVVELNTQLLSEPASLDFSPLMQLAQQNGTQAAQNNSQLQAALQQMLSQSQQLDQNLTSQVQATSTIDNDSKEFVQHGNKLLQQANVLLNNWQQVVAANADYNHNFGHSMSNTKNDDNAARKIYGNLVQPLKFQNAGTIQNLSSIFPYFLTLANIIIGGFAAWLIAGNDQLSFQLKSVKAEESLEVPTRNPFFYQQYVLILVLGISFLVAWITRPLLHHLLYPQLWLIIETLIQATVIEVAITLFKFLRSAGKFIFVLFFIEYIFYTPALGQYLTKSPWVGFCLKYTSPLQQIENIYSNIFTNQADNVLIILIFGVLLLVCLMLNLRFKEKLDVTKVKT